MYLSEDGGADVAIQTLADGAVRAHTVINEAKDSHEFAYDMGAKYKPVQDAEGSFWVVGFDDVGEFQAFSVEDAWAKDANGKSVPTHYEIRGTKLVQIVSPRPRTEYPVVADPTWQWYQFAYGAGMSKSETRAIAANGGVGFLCGFVPGALRVACGIAGGYWLYQATLAKNAGGCVFYAAAPGPIAMRWLSPECR